MNIPTLYAIHYSPWSHRARWALEHHQIPFHYREHTPLLGEFSLRLRARSGGVQGRVTAPMLVLPGEVISDSWDIICYADRVGAGSPLQTQNSEIANWATCLEPAYDAARQRVTRKTLESPSALAEAAAGAVPGWLAGPSRPIAAIGARFIARKYGFDPNDECTQEPLIAGLESIREALDSGPFLYDTFSAADIMAACLITAVQPHTAAPLKPATRAVWTDDALVERFSDLVTWRDQLRAQ